jgi:peptide chain release factor 2
LDIEREKSTHTDLWENPEQAQQILQNISKLEADLEKFRKVENLFLELKDFSELAEGEEDESIVPELERMLEELEQTIEHIELEMMLNGEDDDKNAILTIHPGAGGTESQDWAEMLLRMYLRWVEQSRWDAKIIDRLDGDEAGLKDVTVEVTGENAYGYLKSEAGIHRLVRISPFDANHRRHTSFASVFVYPDIDDDIEIEIDPDDLRIDTFRSSGAGGQHVNKTDSAIRITHIPTGIVVQCQNERSQFKNKATAMKILRARLYQLRQHELEKERDKIEQSKKEIAWGNQIRSYVFHPYTMVKDHRTKYEVGNVQAVMDGNLDGFIRAFLLMQAKKENQAA